MTIEQAIAKVDALRPNGYDNEMKVDWLSYLDGSIYDTIIKTHENPPIDNFRPYSSDNMGVSLIAQFPYDEMYISYLGMKIDEANNETTRYNNSATMFNALLADFRSAYTREHRPKRSGQFTYIRR